MSSIVIRLDVLHGHLRWKATDLARVSKVSRSVIYETMGSNKKEMLLFSLKTLLEEIFWLSPESKKLREELDGHSILMRTRKYALESPELISFYFRRREGDDEAGQLIRQIEKQYMDEISEVTGVTDKSKLLLARVFFHGLSIAPFLNDGEASKAMDQFFSLLSGE